MLAQYEYYYLEINSRHQKGEATPIVGNHVMAKETAINEGKTFPNRDELGSEEHHTPRFFLDITGHPYTTQIIYGAKPTTQKGCPVMSGDFVTPRGMFRDFTRAKFI